MKPRAFIVALALSGAALSLPAHATGLATCDSGARDGWQTQEKNSNRIGLGSNREILVFELDLFQFRALTVCTFLNFHGASR